MDGVSSGLNWEVFKLPLGFIRLVQFPLVIIAFATACDYSGHFVYKPVKCPGNTTAAAEHRVDWSYPFNLASATVPVNSCAGDGETVAFFSQTYQSSSQFYVFMGVMTFLWILASCYVYAARWGQYESDPRLAKGDLVVSVVLAVCWVCGWIAWAASVDGIKGAVNQDENYELLGIRDDACKAEGLEAIKAKCTILAEKSHWGVGHLTISALAGFAVVVAALGNVWFVWKETEWHKLRQTNTDLNAIPGANSPGPDPAATGPAAAAGKPYDPNDF